MELRAFSAPRNGDLWTDVRPQLAADMARRGGTATEREGRFGTELVCQLSVQTNDGKTAQQPSRIVGINGPRWMLRATFLGRAGRGARERRRVGGHPREGRRPPRRPRDAGRRPAAAHAARERPAHAPTPGLG